MAILATRMFNVVVHQAEEGGYWAEVLELPGCVSQGETLDELRSNIREAIEAVSPSDMLPIEIQVESYSSNYRVLSSDPRIPADFPVGGSQAWTASVA